MTYEMLKRFAKFLKVKWDVSSGAIRIAEPPDFEDEYVTLDWDIRPDDVREFSRVEGPCFTAEKPSKSGWYWHKDSSGKIVVVRVDDDFTATLPGEDCLYAVKPMPWSNPDIELDGEWAGPLEPPT